MNLTILDTIQPSIPAPLPIDPGSLYHAFDHVPDGRKQRGKRYLLALIFTLLVLGKLAGETTIQGIAEWVELSARDLRKQLDWPRRFPSRATYTRALACCDAEELVRVVAGVVLKARAKQREQTATKEGSMSRAPLHALIWSKEQRFYELYTQGQIEQRFQPAEEAAWLAWLHGVSSLPSTAQEAHSMSTWRRGHVEVRTGMPTIPKRAAPASAISDKRKASRWRV